MSFLAWGLALGAGIAVKYYFDKLTEEEREYQRELRREHNAYREKIERLKNEYCNKAREKLNSQYSRYDFETKNLLKQALEENIIEVAKHYNLLKEKVTERLEDRKKLLAEFEEDIEKFKKMKDENALTYIRIKTNDILLNELYDSKSKLNGYIKYLEEYQKNLDKRYNNFLNKIENSKRDVENGNLDKLYFGELEVEEFEFLLPENYPYAGRIIKVNINDIDKDGKFSKSIKGISFTANNGEIFYKKDFRVVDLENIERYRNKDIEIQVMIETKENFSWNVNFGKAFLIKNLIEQPEIGIEAEVKRVEDNMSILEYYGVELELRRENYLNAKIPMIGAKKRIYPLERRKNISGTRRIKVTENIEDSLVLEYIPNIPLVITEDKKLEFIEKIEKIGEELKKCNSTSWKVGPLKNEETKLKFQLGEKLVFLADLKKENNKNYLEFEKIIDEKFSSTDIFMTLNGTIKNIDKNPKTGNIVTTEEEQQSINKFILLLGIEFENQRKIQENQDGVIYFKNWLDITNKLINYLSLDKDKKNEISCMVRNLTKTKESKRDKIVTWEADILDIDSLNEKLDKINQESSFGKIEFFIGDGFNKAQIRFDKIGDKKLEILVRFNKDYFEENIEDIIELKIYKKVVPYPEIQQRKALESFMRDDIENINIRNGLLNGKNIPDVNKNIDIKQFFNESIKNNIYQKNIVEEALSAKDLYLIQGPPGTGKTTVIKEIILQFLKQYPNSNILITSQTNVAVDNVLKGLKDYIAEDEMVRCGNDDRIDEGIRSFSYESLIKNYKIEFHNSVVNNEDEENIKRQWEEYIETEEESKNELGELLLKSKKIIGATCVGIAKKRIGLDNMIFDLVIVDEASKALPAEILIPLIRAKKAIIIGDQKQLPPTINSALTNEGEIELENREEFEENLFSQSFFGKLFDETSPKAKNMLRTQYRMPSTIGSLISKFFYDNELENGEICDFKESVYFNKNLVWLDTSNIKNCFENTSKGIFNEKEIEIIFNLVENIRNSKIDNKIAIITPYKEQNRRLKKYFRNKFKNVVIDTIDSFQGDEADIVIFSTTRSRIRTNFFSTDERINVAFSRAKKNLVIVGSIKYFEKYGKDSKMYKIAEYIKENGEIQKLN